MPLGHVRYIYKGRSYKFWRGLIVSVIRRSSAFLKIQSDRWVGNPPPRTLYILKMYLTEILSWVFVVVETSKQLIRLDIQRASALFNSQKLLKVS